MKSTEQGILSNSNLYFYTPSAQAHNLFLYPLCVGHFIYDKTYQLTRNNYDSFLLMYIKKGECTIEINQKSTYAKENQIVILDCFQPHRYYTEKGWEALWIHFDGITAREYYQLILSECGNVISLQDTYSFQRNLEKIYQLFHDNQVIKEALVSQRIISLLTDLLVSPSVDLESNRHSTIIEETISYIHEHIDTSLSLPFLAKMASLSPFYFLRLFKEETGFTPHEYIILSRINLAKFTLKTTDIPIKEIAFHCGFTSESCFCTTFKKWVSMTPSGYRSSTASVM